jgi:ankyrin repeat protein
MEKTNEPQVNYEGWSDLTLAAYEGDTAAIRELLDAGKSPNEQADSGITPLIASAIGGHEEITATLIEYGADPHCSTPEKNTPLMAAAFHGHAAVAQCLLNHDRHIINLRNLYGYTAIMAAALQGHEEVIHVLLSFGADITDKLVPRASLWSRTTASLRTSASEKRFLCNQSLEPLRQALRPTSSSGLYNALQLALKSGHSGAAEILYNAEHAESNLNRPASEYVVDYSVLPPFVFLKNDVKKVLLARAQGEFLDRIGVRDEQVRDLVGDVVKSAVEGDTALLKRIRVALDAGKAPQEVSESEPQRQENRTLAALQSAVSLQLPDAIPNNEKYKPRQGVIEFLEKGWPAPYIKAGVLSRPDLHRLDPNASMALRNFLRKGTLPDHLRIPERGERTKQLAADPDSVREAWRIARAHDRTKGHNR